MLYSGSLDNSSVGALVKLAGVYFTGEESEMSTIHFCLLCHTEGTADDFTIGLPAMLKLRERVERQTGRKVPFTWTLGTYHFNDPEKNQLSVFDEYGEIFKELLERGDEIGLHPHGIPDENCVMKIDPFISADTKALQDAGFPKPNTIVVGTWSLYPSTVQIIEQEVYHVDSSVAGGKQVQDGIVIYEYPPDDTLHAVWRRPYRIARDNVLRSGDSGVIEVPISVHVTEFGRGEEEELVWEFFEHYITKRFKMRWERREEIPVDVFEVFWHPSEAIENWPSRNLNTPMLERFEKFLLQISTWEGVQFSTVYDAAMDWNHRTEDVLSGKSA